MVKIKHNKLAAAIAVMLALCLLVPAAMPSEEPEPVQTQPQLGAFEWATFLVGFVLGVAVGSGLTAAYLLSGDATTGDNNETTRTNEMNSVMQLLTTNLETANNFTDIINDLTPLTKMHFNRQAELAAAFNWTQGAAYNPQTILDDSGVYTNVANLTKDLNLAYSKISGIAEDRTSKWVGNEVYDGKMSWTFIYGNDAEGISGSSMSFSYVNVAAPSEESKVYISGSDIWTSAASEITGPDGKTISLTAGHNSLEMGLEGVYALQSGVIYAANMVPTPGIGAAAVYTGLIMNAGENTEIAYYDNDKMVLNNNEWDSISLRLSTTDGNESSLIPVCSPIAKLDKARQAVEHIIYDANNAAAAVWDIYTAAGDVNFYITTTSIPETYNEVQLSAVEKEVIAILSMQQMADYSDANAGKIMTKGYKFTPQSTGLYCYGSIKDGNGVVKDNVIFTPFFYSSDLTLSIGSNNVNQNGLVTIWKENAASISDWDGETMVSEAGLLTVVEGSTLNITSISHDGNSVDHVDLTVEKINIHIPDDYTPTDPIIPSGDKDWKSLLIVIFAIIGGAVIVIALFTDPRYIILGITIVILAFTLVPWLYDKLGGWGII